MLQEFEVGDRVQHDAGHEADIHGRPGTVVERGEGIYIDTYRVVWGPYPFVDGESGWNWHRAEDLWPINLLDRLAEAL